jgi:hypothetical protein
VAGFDRVFATASGGFDSATLRAAGPDDIYEALAAWRRLSGSGYDYVVAGFDTVQADLVPRKRPQPVPRQPSPAVPVLRARRTLPVAAARGRMEQPPGESGIAAGRQTLATAPSAGPPAGQAAVDTVFAAMPGHSGEQEAQPGSL